MTLRRRATTRRSSIAVFGLMALVGCVAQRANLPTLTSPPTQQHRVGEFVWFDLLVDDPESAKAFYGPLFGWTFESLEEGSYDTIVHGGRPIGGIIRHTPENDQEPDDLWLPSVSVGDVDQATERARAGGAQILREPRKVGQRGRLSVVRDPEGATFVLMRSEGGDPKDPPPAPGDFLWVQLWTRDHQIPVKFYDQVTDWKIGKVVSHDGVEEGVFENATGHVAGLIELPWPNVQPNWLPYVRVEDVDATIASATNRGGRVLVRGERLAILQDPQGAAIGVALLMAEPGGDR